MPAKATSLRNQANAIQPFNYAQASGPELPSSIAAINTVNASEMEVMQMEGVRRKDDQDRERFNWMTENRDDYNDLLGSLDPTSDEFDEILGKVDPRAYEIPGFAQAIGSRVNQRTRHLQREEREFVKNEREIAHWESGMKGADPRIIIDLKHRYDTGAITREEYRDEAAGIAGKVHDVKQAEILKSDTIAQDKRDMSEAKSNLSSTKSIYKEVKSDKEKIEKEIAKLNLAVQDKSDVNDDKSKKGKKTFDVEEARLKVLRKQLSDITPEFEAIRDTYNGYINVIKGKPAAPAKSSTPKASATPKGPNPLDIITQSAKQ